LSVFKLFSTQKRIFAGICSIYHTKMLIFYKIETLKRFLKDYRKKDCSIGLVPTMGALHKGHLKLIEASLSENDITICSIFVNPEQFNSQKDLENYPRNFENDQKKIEAIGCSVIFHPAFDEIYSSKPEIHLDFGTKDKVMEGAFRENHFNGVGIVVAKLFNIVDPDNAYFGQKDFQQIIIIEKLVEDLSFDVNIITVPTVRETDGLAFSSRNLNLTPAQRETAPVLYQSLLAAKKGLQNGKTVSEVNLLVGELCNTNEVVLEYFEVVQGETLENVKRISSGKKNIVLCIAAKIGSVRLIDNVMLFD
jgi:pantoate--beta-alanine ligase